MDDATARVLAPATQPDGDGAAAPAPVAAGADRTATVLHLRRAVARAGGASPSPAGAPLPVLGVLGALLPEGGLRRGALVEVVGSPALALALAAAPVRTGAWAACVGLPALGWSAAASMGWDLRRVVAVAPPARRWSAVMAALVDAVDLLLLGPDPAPSAAEARRLCARARERGAVLLLPEGGRGGWAGLADVRLEVVAAEWSGLGQGWGHLAGGRLTVECTGRRAASRPRRVEVELPGGAP